MTLNCEGREGHWLRELRLWLTAPCYNYKLTFNARFLPNTFTPWVIISCFFFPLSSHLCANLLHILRWHVFPKLVLLLIRLVLENQTKHDTALAWWCHDVMNTTLTLLTLCPHLPSMCQSLVSHKQVCVCVHVQISDIFWRLNSDRACF